jgi:hypothetical protein
LLRPTPISGNVCDHQSRQIKNYPGNIKKIFQVGDSIMAKEFKQGGKESWSHGKIESVLTPGVTYLVNVGNNVTWKRHGNQLIKSYDEVLDKEKKKSRGK